MTLARGGIGSVIVAAVLAAQAQAECPTTPDDPVCRPWSAVLLPTVYGGLYAPKDGPTYFGGGLEVVLLAWSDNSEAFGPSQGRVRFDIGVLEGNQMDSGTLVMYRAGAQVAFERNASRAYGIPYFAVDFGGMSGDGLGRRYFVDGGIGVYLVHRRGLIVDAEVTGLVPFKNPNILGGVTSRLALSFALW
ncbi:MAG: hypothetical protein H0T89_14130 [Deltaproteobacteria bacterium]|nr:hypothetical protein [Deltaproteobacteria bacterium]MDQ3300132.1 hypothetical protein [Myxococcota bacterium]